jgi:hypothetical protein
LLRATIVTFEFSIFVRKAIASKRIEITRANRKGGRFPAKGCGFWPNRPLD